MKLHGTLIDDMRRQTRLLGKLLTHANHETFEALDIDVPSFKGMLEAYRADYWDIFVGFKSSADQIAKFNKSCIAYVTTITEPILCYLALTKPAAGELHTAMDNWGAFDMVDALSARQKENLAALWEIFTRKTGTNISQIERPRKFSFYEIPYANRIEDKLPALTGAEIAFAKSVNPVFDVGNMLCPSVTLVLIQGMARHRLNTRDQVRCIGEFEDFGSVSVGVLATTEGAAELNLDLAHRVPGLRLSPKRFQTHYGATLQ